jgi:hypothetical protein
VVGVAQERVGYDIPIETVLAKFNQKREIAFSQSTNIDFPDKCTTAKTSIQQVHHK